MKLFDLKMVIRVIENRPNLIIIGNSYLVLRCTTKAITTFTALETPQHIKSHVIQVNLVIDAQSCHIRTEN